MSLYSKCLASVLENDEVILSLPSTFTLFYHEKPVICFLLYVATFFLTTPGRDFMQFLNAKEIVQLHIPSAILAG